MTVADDQIALALLAIVNAMAMLAQDVKLRGQVLSGLLVLGKVPKPAGRTRLNNRDMNTPVAKGKHIGTAIWRAARSYACP